MAKSRALSGTNGVVVGVAAVAAAGAVAIGFYLNGRLAPAPESDGVIEAAIAPETSPGSPPPAPAAAPDLVTVAPPSIDEVRLESDGLTIIAGRAAPGSEVSVLLDGTKNTSVTADQGGAFAAITILPPSPKAQVLSVVQRVGTDELASVDEVILAPQARVEPAPQIAHSAPAADTGHDATGSALSTAAVPAANPAPGTAPAPAAPAAPGAPSGIAGAVTAAADIADAPATAPAAATPVAPATTQAEQTAPASSDIAARAATPPATPRAAAAPPAGDASDVTVLRSTADGVEVLSAARPQVLENIELDSISYSQTGDVQLAGRAQIESEVVRVYIDNRPIADLSVGDAGDWRGELPQIDTGVYQLRVDELNAAGEVTSRIETPFRREDPAVLAQADDTTSPATQITVQAGNSLWSISRDRYGEGRRYIQLFAANRDRIRDPDLIYPGQVFALPE